MPCFRIYPQKSRGERSVYTKTWATKLHRSKRVQKDSEISITKKMDSEFIGPELAVEISTTVTRSLMYMGSSVKQTQ